MELLALPTNEAPVNQRPPRLLHRKWCSSDEHTSLSRPQTWLSAETLHPGLTRRLRAKTDDTHVASGPSCGEKLQACNNEMRTEQSVKLAPQTFSLEHFALLAQHKKNGEQQKWW